MSRIVKQPIAVEANPETNEPLLVDGSRVLRVLEHFREWIGILQGELERDIWRVEVPRGICKLHCIQPNPIPAQSEQQGFWILHCWMD